MEEISAEKIEKLEELKLEKLVERLDNKKIDELVELIDQLPSINEIVKTLLQLKESGVLDTLVELSYLVKAIRDMLTEDNIKNFAEILGNLLELSEALSKNINKLKELLRNIDTVNDLVSTLQQLKASGTLDAIINVAYFLKAIMDMLNDEAIANLATTISSVMDSLKLLQTLTRGLSS